MPTETVYGLAVRPYADGVAKIFEIKRRPREKSVQLLVPDTTWLERLAVPTAEAAALADAFWPGPLTLVLPASAQAPGAVVADGTIGVRVPNHPIALEVLRRVGPLAASSANLSGEPAPTTADDIRSIFGDLVDAYLDGGTIVGTGSTVVDLTRSAIRVLREGPISIADVKSAVEGRLGRA